MESVLDSNRLLSIKSQNGLKISYKGTTSIYLSSRKLEKLLKDKLKNLFSYSIDLNIFVDKIIDKSNTIEMCEVIEEYVLNCNDLNSFIDEGSKIKTFIIKMKKIADEKDSNDKDVDIDSVSESSKIDLTYSLGLADDGCIGGFSLLDDED